MDAPLERADPDLVMFCLSRMAGDSSPIVGLFTDPVLDQFKVGAGAWTAVRIACNLVGSAAPRL
jgi:hypothetical protein